MKKIVFFVFLLFCFPISVLANDLKLDELTIKNGELSIPFDPLNNEYTILLEKEEYTVEFEYKVDEKIAVFISDNHDLQNNAVVTISLTDEKNVVEYHFQIWKEEVEQQPVFQEITPQEENNIMFTYKNYIIPSTCFLLIGLVFKILFHKHKK